MIQSETTLAGLKYIETESFENTFQGLFSEIELSSPKLGKKYEDRNARLRKWTDLLASSSGERRFVFMGCG